MRPRATAGFTLLEALVAMAILTFVVMYFQGMRTDALVDSTEARNQRIARELAEHHLSELKAGAREMPPESGVELTLEKFPGFSLKFLIGETAITEHETMEAGFAEDSEGWQKSQQLDWQRDRDEVRRANSRGLDLVTYRDQQLQDKEKEDQVPSETDYEEVAVVVYYPDVRRAVTESRDVVASYVLKAKVSTLAIAGITPQQAEALANQKGVQQQGPNQPVGGSNAAGGTGNAGTGAGADAGNAAGTGGKSR
jgi:prepilin-type N-terminal cleavage/methylation domain-containing protein